MSDTEETIEEVNPLVEKTNKIFDEVVSFTEAIKDGEGSQKTDLVNSAIAKLITARQFVLEAVNYKE